jgi:hypothetical protein
MFGEIRKELEQMASVMKVKIPDVKIFSKEECVSMSKDELISKFLCLQEVVEHEIKMLNTQNTLSEMIIGCLKNQMKFSEDIVRAAGLGDVLDEAADAEETCETVCGENDEKETHTACRTSPMEQGDRK